MAQVIPASTVTLYSNIKIQKGMGPTFSTPMKRETYFQQNIERANTPVTYVRRDGEVQLEVPFSVVNRCNYISFVNPSFENRIWYGFITNFEYENNENCIIYYVIDPFMTYMFDFTMVPCMLARQMLSQDDTVLANTNPYNPNIWQFTTPEDLATDRVLEKPVYNLRRFSGGDGNDGKYMLSTEYITTNEAYDYDIGTHIMAVLFIAPLSVEKLDEGIEDNYLTSTEWATVRGQILIMVENNIQTTIEGHTVPAAYPTEWDAAVDLVKAYVDSLTTAEIPSDYALAIDGAILSTKGVPASEHLLRTQDYFMQIVDKAVLSTGNAPSAEWATLRQRIIDAGGYIFDAESSYVSGNGTFAGRVPHSSFARGYDIIAISGLITGTGTKLFSEVLAKLTKWDAISQIVAIYAMNDYVFLSAFVDSDGVVPSPGDIAQNNIYTVPTSFTRMNNNLQHSVNNKKLLTFPFSYMRVISPRGDTKEYKYEEFSDVMLGTGSPEFKIMGDLNSRPSILMAPIKYKRWSSSYDVDGIDMSDATNVNLDEMINYDEFAQVPFVTDAYLTYISGQVMNAFAQNTLDYQDERELQKLKARVGLVNDVKKTGKELVSDMSPRQDKHGNKLPITPGQIGGAGLNLGTNILNTIVNYEDAMMEPRHYEARLGEAQAYLSANGEFDYERFNGTKPAHANNIYHPGSNGGIYTYIKGITTTDFILEHVQLRDAVLDKYDRYFTYYGYNEAGRADVPYIYNFMRASNDTSKLPTWNIDDENDQITYVQTVDAHVSGIPLPYAQYIEALFNSGYRFINGDALITT